MDVLVACEYSGTVRDAFRRRGHNAMSCDLLPSDAPGPHYRGDVRDLLGLPWDILIAHPPRTFLTRAGARWWPGRQQEQEEALDFVRLLLAAPIEKIGLENPPGAIGTRIARATQYVHPWQFGHMEKKMTGLWLKGLPPLRPTNDVREEMLKLSVKEQNRVHWMAPGPDRWKARSVTYLGVAEAMADQWG